MFPCAAEHQIQDDRYRCAQYQGSEIAFNLPTQQSDQQAGHRRGYDGRRNRHPRDQFDLVHATGHVRQKGIERRRHEIREIQYFVVPEPSENRQSEHWRQKKHHQAADQRHPETHRHIPLGVVRIIDDVTGHRITDGQGHDGRDQARHRQGHVGHAVLRRRKEVRVQRNQQERNQLRRHRVQREQTDVHQKILVFTQGKTPEPSS